MFNKKWLEKAQYSANLETDSAISWHWVSNMVLENASLGNKGRKWACTCLPSLLWLIWGIVCVKFCGSRDLIPSGDASNRSPSKSLIKLKCSFLPSHFEFYLPRGWHPDRGIGPDCQKETGLLHLVRVGCVHPGGPVGTWLILTVNRLCCNHSLRRAWWVKAWLLKEEVLDQHTTCDQQRC